ncbi:MAG: hypothetical protein KBB14_11065 [Thermoanaerobaculia bacterium]|nr:hypothetical protein [Thermoanaerobaculia bacterium]
MTPAERLERFALAMELLEGLEVRLAAAIEAKAITPGQIPEDVGQALRRQSEDVLSLALRWDDLLEAARTLGLPEPFGGREAYAAYLQSLHLYGAETAELVQ